MHSIYACRYSYTRLPSRRVQLGQPGDLISEGDKAPEFEAVDDRGNPISLRSLLANGAAVLVFYPGDNTPVCTSQLCAFRDNYAELTALGVTVAGVNAAGVAKHRSFAERHSFPFPLIADIGGEIAKKYGCRAMFGLTKRTVYAITADGVICCARRGNPNPAEIVKALKAAGKASQ